MSFFNSLTWIKEGKEPIHQIFIFSNFENYNLAFILDSGIGHYLYVETYVKVCKQKYCN